MLCDSLLVLLPAVDDEEQHEETQADDHTDADLQLQTQTNQRLTGAPFTNMD